MPAARMTFTVPSDLKRRAQRMKDVNWSGVVQDALERKIRILEELDRIASKSRLTAKDVREISKRIKEGMHRRLVEAARRGQ